jgi:hypothetical protein
VQNCPSFSHNSWPKEEGSDFTCGEMLGPYTCWMLKVCVGHYSEYCILECAQYHIQHLCLVRWLWGIWARGESEIEFLIGQLKQTQWPVPNTLLYLMVFRWICCMITWSMWILQTGLVDNRSWHLPQPKLGLVDPPKDPSILLCKRIQKKQKRP